MAYQGNSPAANFQSLPAVQRFNGTGSATAFTLASVIPNDQSILVSVDGVTQDSNAYAVNGTTLTFTAAPSAGTGNIFINTISPVGSTVVPPDGSVSTAKLVDGSVTQAKVAGEAINESKLQVSNSPTNGLFLSAQSGNTGGLTWAEASAGKVLQVVTATTTTTVTSTSTTYIDSGLTANITPSSTSSRIMIMVTHPTNVYAADAVVMGLRLLRGSTNVWENARWRQVSVQTNNNVIATQSMHYVDSPSSTSALTYKTQFARLVANGSPTTASLQPESAIAIITLMEIGG